MFRSSSNTRFRLWRLNYIIILVLSLTFTYVCAESNIAAVITPAVSAESNIPAPTQNPSVSARARKNIVCRDPDLGGQVPVDIHTPRKVSICHVYLTLYASCWRHSTMLKPYI